MADRLCGVLGVWICVCGIQAAGVRADEGDKKAELARADLRLVRVVLYSAGMGMFEYEGEVSESALFAVPVAARDVNQLLRTATVFDPANRATIRLPAAADPVRPVPPSPDAETLGSLLLSMRGETVSITKKEDGEMVGRLVAVEIRSEVEGDQLVDREHVSLLTADGLVTVPLAEIESVLPGNPEYRERLNRELDRMRAPQSNQPQVLEVLFGKDNARTVRIGLLRDVPVWKSTYVADLAGLRHRAIVENVTDQDWDDVTLVLADGSPISFEIDLESITRVERPKQRRLSQRRDVAPEFGEGEAAAVAKMEEGLAADLFMRGDGSGVGSGMGGMGGGMGGMGGGGSGGAFGGGAGVGDPFAAPREGQASPENRLIPARMVDAQSGFRSRQAEVSAGGEGQSMLLEYKHASVPAGKSVLLDMVIQPVTVSLVSVYREDYAAAKPMLAFELESASPYRLPPGPMTLFLDDRGYGGEAMLPMVSPNVPQIIGFAIDEGVRVVPSTDAASKVLQSVEIDERKKTLTSTYIYDRMHHYEVRNRSGSGRVVLVEHRGPSDPYKVVESIATPLKTPFGYRYRVEVADGETQTLDVPEQYVETSLKTFASWSIESLREWMLDEKLEVALRDKITRVVEDREAFETATEGLKKLASQRAETTKEISRITDQLRSRNDTRLPTELITRYEKRLIELEDALDENQAQIVRFSELKNSIAARLGIATD